MSQYQQKILNERAPEVDRGRTQVAEVTFTRPLPGVAKGNAYIGSGPAWNGFVIMADFTQRLMIVTLPDKRCVRVPFENVTCFVV